MRDELQLHFEAAAIRQRRRIFRAAEEQMRKDGVVALKISRMLSASSFGGRLAFEPFPNHLVGGDAVAIRALEERKALASRVVPSARRGSGAASAWCTHRAHLAGRVTDLGHARQGTGFSHCAVPYRAQSPRFPSRSESTPRTVLKLTHAASKLTGQASPCNISPDHPIVAGRIVSYARWSRRGLCTANQLNTPLAKNDQRSQ
jgi:hypothetical protein